MVVGTPGGTTIITSVFQVRQLGIHHATAADEPRAGDLVGTGHERLARRLD